MMESQWCNFALVWFESDQGCRQILLSTRQISFIKQEFKSKNLQSAVYNFQIKDYSAT